MSVAGKARHFPTSLELIYDNKRETRVLHALIRDSVAKPGTASSRPIGSAFAVPGSLGNTNVFTEPIALNPKAFIITSDAPDTIRIDKTFGKYSSRIIVTGEGGAADNITTIIGKDDGEGNTGKAAFAGQILNIEAVLTTPLTLIDGADIATPGGASFLIRGGSNVTLIYDSTLDKWKFLHDALVQRLSDLLDVTIGGDPLATGHHLEFTGTVWENKEDITFVSGGANLLNINTLNWIGGHQLTRGASAPHLDLVMSGDTTFRMTVNSNIMFEVSDIAALGLKMSQPIYMQNETLFFDTPAATRSIKFDGTSSLDYKVPAANFHRFFAGVAQRFGVNDDQVIVDTVPLRLPEITTPSPDPAANSGFIYGKVIGGTHAEPHWLDELGTETNLLGGGGPPFDDNQVIIQDEVDNTKTLTFNLSLLATANAHLISFATSTGSRSYTFPDNTGIMAMLNASQTFSGNNTFTGTDNIIEAETSFHFVDPIDATKRIEFVTSLLGTATTNFLVFNGLSGSARSWTFPDLSGTILLTGGEQFIFGQKTFQFGDLRIQESGGSPFDVILNAGTLISSDQTATFPDITGTVVLLEGTQTFVDLKTFGPDTTNAGLNFGSVAGDPSSLNNGDVWYNSTSNKFRAREAGASVDMIGGGGGGNSISQLDSSLTVTDTGTDGQFVFITDSITLATWDDAIGLEMLTDIDMNLNEIHFNSANRFIRFNSIDNGIRIEQDTGEQFNLMWLGAVEYDFNQTEFDMHNNDLVNVDDIRMSASGDAIIWPIGTDPNKSQIEVSTANMRLRTGFTNDEIVMTLLTTDMVDININEVRMLNTSLEMDLNEEIRWTATPGGVPRIRAITGNEIEYEVGTIDFHDFKVGSNFDFRISEGLVELFGNFTLGMELRIFRDDATPNDNDILGLLSFDGRDSSNNRISYGEIIGEMADVTSTSRDGRLLLRVQSNNSTAAGMIIEGGGTSGTPKIGFRGAAAQAVIAWAASGHSVDRNLTGSGTTELRNVLGTLINDLEAMGILG